MNIDFTELLRNYYSAHIDANHNRELENRYLEDIREILQGLYPEDKVKVEDGYITIGYFTTIKYEDIKPIMDLGITDFYIDTHLQVETHYLKIPNYYNNLKIYIDIDALVNLIEEQ